MQPTRAVGATAASGWTPPRTWEAPASRGWPGEAYAPRQPMRLSDETAARSARVRSAWLVAVTVTVTAILVASLLTFAWPIRDGGTTPTAAPRSSPSPTTPRNSGTGGRQSVRPVAPKSLAAAKEIDKLLARSAAQRSTLQRAVTCRRSAAAAVRDLEEVYDGRRRLLEQVGDANFAPLPGGEHLQHHLRQAWELSMYADANFLEWATYRVRTPRPCTTATESYEAGLIQSAAAQRHKRKFIEQWEKTVRRPMGLAAVRTETDM
ncbi:hypothetical protein [Agilicoccus flavus]|uniref:hypothetical protein n=1 Tax=Agilicoccus flavus TaxID=2775968 RepID=UPI001CF6939C|nr:hypothetical protein [Agilicoccus flavus]